MRQYFLANNGAVAMTIRPCRSRSETMRYAIRHIVRQLLFASTALLRESACCRVAVGTIPALLTVLFALSFSVAGGPAQADEADVPFMAIDRESGAVLLHNRAFERWYPASLAKLMTIYVALAAIRDGEVQEGSPVVISGTAANQPPSRMGYAPGSRLRVDTALKILVVKSANDVAVAVAEAVAGNVGNFVSRMNAAARDIGMRDSRFANPNGLHDTGQYVTARDVALLARRLLTEFPRFSDTFAVPAIRSGEQVHYSYNLLLERFDGADGMKTGFVCASGYNMVATATRNGRQIIVVVLGAFSQTERAVLAARLLLAGFETSGGIPLGRFEPASPAAPAKSRRGTMCSEEARRTRYDPGAGDALIDSPLLSPRTRTRNPVPVATGGIDAPPSEALKFASYIPRGEVPVPVPRPEFTRRDIDGFEISGPAPPAAIPIPTPRPEAAAN